MPVRELLDVLSRFPDPISRAEALLRNLPLLRDYVESTLEQAARLSRARAPWESPVGRRAAYSDPTFTAVAILEENETYQLARAVVRFIDRLPEDVQRLVEDVYVRRTRSRSNLPPEDAAILGEVLKRLRELLHEDLPTEAPNRAASWERHFLLRVGGCHPSRFRLRGIAMTTTPRFRRDPCAPQHAGPFSFPQSGDRKAPRNAARQLETRLELSGRLHLDRTPSPRRDAALLLGRGLKPRPLHRSERGGWHGNCSSRFRDAEAAVLQHTPQPFLRSPFHTGDGCVVPSAHSADRPPAAPEPPRSSACACRRSRRHAGACSGGFARTSNHQHLTDACLSGGIDGHEPPPEPTPGAGAGVAASVGSWRVGPEPRASRA